MQEDESDTAHWLLFYVSCIVLTNYGTQANKHGFVGRGISTERRKHTRGMNFFYASWQ